MMNLLARILSHGFAFAVVALIIIVLMYRGEFTAWELPEYLAIDGQPKATQEAYSGTVEREVDEAKLPVASQLASPGSSEEVPATASVTDAGDEAPSGEGIPAAGGEPDAESDTTPVTDGETAADIPYVAKPDVGSATGAATDSPPVEADDEPSMPPPADRDDSAARTTDDASAQTGDETTDEIGSPVEAAPATAVDERSDDSTVQPADDTMATTEDAAADQAATMLEPAPAAVTEEAAHAEVIPSETGSAAPAAVIPPAMEAPAPATVIPPAMKAPAPAEVMPPVMEAPAAAAVMPPVMEAPAAAEDTTSVAEELAPAAESVPASKPLATPPSQHTRQAISETPYEVMAKAREAFWLRDFELAEQQYRKLTLLEPDNPDGYGELGNMYFSQGKWEESAAAYYQAGTRLLNEGMVQEARQMVDVIRGLKGSQADDLEAQIDAVSASSP